MMKSARVALLTGAMIVQVTPAQADEVSDLDRFKLLNHCNPVALIVEQLHTDATDIGLSKADIETTARSRLRAARLFDPDAQSFFYLSMNVVGPAYALNAGYHKLVYDAPSDLAQI